MSVQTVGLFSNNRFIQFYKSSVGKKFIMAITGLMLIGFVVAHLLGNLQIFLGPEKFNGYAAFLKSISGVLWSARIILLAAVILHIYTGIVLRSINRSARKVTYKDMKDVKLDAASKYMFETGVVILLFIILHLLHFTLGVLQPEYFHGVDKDGHPDVYRMVIDGFQNGPYVFIYIISMFALSFHLRHAFWSMFQSVGAYSPDAGVLLKKFSRSLALIVAIAYISIPFAVWMGWLN